MENNVKVVNSNDSKIAILANIRSIDKLFSSETRKKHIIIRYKSTLDCIIDKELCCMIVQNQQLCFLEMKHPKLILDRKLLEPNLRQFLINKVK